MTRKVFVGSVPKMTISHFASEVTREWQQLSYLLDEYEKTGDHDHGRGPIVGGSCTYSGECWACATRRALDALAPMVRT